MPPLPHHAAKERQLTRFAKFLKKTATPIALIAWAFMSIIKTLSNRHASAKAKRSAGDF